MWVKSLFMYFVISLKKKKYNKNRKMRRISIITLVFSLTFLAYSSAFAQKISELFMAKAYKRALKKQTRSVNGKPGAAYWQNQSDYKITASFDVENRTIYASEEITYWNNSPDTLKQLYFNLIQDLYKRGVARDWDLGQVDLHDGVKIKSIKIDGEPVSLYSKRLSHNSTKMRLNLLKYFSPKSQHKVQVCWEVILPGTRTVRMGTYNKTNFMVAYWYPKIAVYDDLWAWAREPHKGNCEYYNEFGNFEVELKAPKGFMLWGTGTLTNREEIYQESIISRLDAAAKSDEVTSIVKTSDIENGKVLAKGDSLIWKFKAENVPDFAFAMSKDYIWDATSIVSGKRRILINAVYKNSSSDFRQVAEIAHKSIDFYTNISPKIAFPFPQITIFNGRGGMEFPAMVNDGDSRNLNGTLYVTSHEIGHSYFPFNTGLNEQLFAWMDEGLITYLPRKFVAKYTDDTSYIAYEDIIKSYNKLAGSIMEVPLMIPSTNTGFSYRYQAYTRSSVAFYTLNEYLGTDTFNLALQEFTKRWARKHPMPYDFFNTFNEVAGEDLAWFWKPWFFELGYADLALKVANDQQFTIVNKGGFPVPVHLKIYLKNGKTETMDFPASIWKNGKKSLSVDFTDKNFKFNKLILDTKLTPDAFPEDNIWEE